MRISIVLTLAVTCFLSVAVAAQSIVQQAYLKAFTNATGAGFGDSVAVSGNTVVVGAGQEPVGGAVHVFVRNGPVWSHQAILKASNFETNDSFGHAVAISGDTIVVGAGQEASAATGINGNQLDNTANGAGAAYVFVRSGTTWTQQAYLKSNDSDLHDAFGRTVSVSGNTVVVGARGEDSAATGVGGNHSDESAPDAGAAYVFVRNGTTWTLESYLKASNAETLDAFGTAVSVSGNTIVVGAIGEDSAAKGVNGNSADNSFFSAGAAYVFVRSGSTWTQQAYLKASVHYASANFGFAASVSEDTILVGSPFAALASGMVFFFVRNGTTWTQQFVEAGVDFGDNFGKTLCVSGNAAVIGAPAEDGNGTGVTGQMFNNDASNSGAVHLLVRSGTTWSHEAYIKASNTGVEDSFGCAVAVDGDTFVSGAVSEDSNATGVNGDQGNNASSLSGAAYMFDLGLDRWADVGFGLAGVNGVPYLAGTGSLVSGSPGSLALVHAKPSAACTFHVSVASMPVPFKGGTLVPFPTLLNIPLVTFPDGTMTLPFVWPAGLPPGTMLWFQYSISDLAAIKKVSLSNALKATTP